MTVPTVKDGPMTEATERDELAKDLVRCVIAGYAPLDVDSKPRALFDQICEDVKRILSAGYARRTEADDLSVKANCRNCGSLYAQCIEWRKNPELRACCPECDHRERRTEATGEAQEIAERLVDGFDHDPDMAGSIATALTESARAAEERCAKAVCPWCAADAPFAMIDGQTPVHLVDGRPGCEAAAIRALRTPRTEEGR